VDQPLRLKLLISGASLTHPAQIIAAMEIKIQVTSIAGHKSRDLL
jgi:hypothetical protein